MSSESRLRVIRDELKVPRERLVCLTNGAVCLSTIRNAECGRHRLTHDKAELLLQAINMVLIEKERPEITLSDLNFKLY